MIKRNNCTIWLSDRKIFFMGSNAVRSRKYQIGVNKYLSILSKTFFIEGLIIDNDNNIETREKFKTGKNYTALIFTRKED
ncbi:hypothetical protein [Daejeonella sp.]|uniref:DUF6934 family protein n=1 Tax=Daejeonella sp. TaxID=2805397 RepID=UPI00352397CA